jgi:c-di-GMP-binding flagellar brake protein YcgR
MSRDHQGMGQTAERRRAPRVEMAVGCMLRRRAGSPISCETVDLGTGGMSVCSERPLAADEVVSFDLVAPALSGRARVLRQHGHQLYALRFEQLADPARDTLEQLVRRAV